MSGKKSPALRRKSELGCGPGSKIVRAQIHRQMRSIPRGFRREILRHDAEFAFTPGSKMAGKQRNDGKVHRNRENEEKDVVQNGELLPYL